MKSSRGPEIADRANPSWNLPLRLRPHYRLASTYRVGGSTFPCPLTTLPPLHLPSSSTPIAQHGEPSTFHIPIPVPTLTHMKFTPAVSSWILATRQAEVRVR